MNESYLISAHPELEFDNKLKSKQAIKAGGSLSLTVNISGIPSPKVAWLKDGKPMEKSPRLSIDMTEEFSTLTIKNATLEDAGMYKMTAENVVGKAEADFEVLIKGIKQLNFGHDETVFFFQHKITAYLYIHFLPALLSLSFIGKLVSKL